MWCGVVKPVVCALLMCADILTAPCVWFECPADVMARYTTRIEADKAKYPVLLGNGNLKEQGDVEGGRHFAVWEVRMHRPHSRIRSRTQLVIPVGPALARQQCVSCSAVCYVSSQL